MEPQTPSCLEKSATGERPFVGHFRVVGPSFNNRKLEGLPLSLQLGGARLVVFSASLNGQDQEMGAHKLASEVWQPRVADH